MWVAPVLPHFGQNRNAAYQQFAARDDHLAGERRTNGLTLACRQLRPVRRSTHGIAIAASSGAGPTWQENSLIPITRNGRREDVYWTYSYGPIDDKDALNEIGGVPVVCTETTPQVLIAQRAGQERERFAALFEQAPTFMARLTGSQPGQSNQVFRAQVSMRSRIGSPTAAETDSRPPLHGLA
jgi:hypothetical protein